MYFVLDSWLLTSMLPRNPAIFLLSVHSQLRQLFHSCSSLHQLSQHTPGPQPHLMTSDNFAGKTNTFSKELLKVPPSGYKPLPWFPFSLSPSYYQREVPLLQPRLSPPHVPLTFHKASMTHSRGESAEITSLLSIFENIAPSLPLKIKPICQK